MGSLTHNRLQCVTCCTVTESGPAIRHNSRQPHLYSNMSDTYHSREEIAAWVLSLKYFRFCHDYPDGPLRGDGERLLVAIRIESEQDLVAVLGQLGIPVERSPVDAPQGNRRTSNHPVPTTRFPDIYQPRAVRIAGVLVVGRVGSDRLELEITDEQDPYVVTEAAVQAARSVEPLLAPLADRIIDPPQVNAYHTTPKSSPQYEAEKPDQLAPLNDAADHRRCSVCSQLADHELASQKVTPDPEDTHLPDAAYRLRSVREVVSESGAPRELWQCPECTTCYLYLSEYEFLIGSGGSEDSQELTRLTAAETAEWLKRPKPQRGVPVRAPANPQPPRLGQTPQTPAKEAPKPQRGAPVISKESVSVDASEPGFISISYVQLDDGIDMGGRLLIERKSLPLITALLHASLNVYAFTEVECRCGEDAFRVYGSGSDQQPIINILNRRPDGATHCGLTGLMMTTPAVEALLEQLGELS